MGYHPVVDNSVYLHSFIRCWLPNLQNSSKRIRTYSRSRSFKVIDLGVSRKRIWLHISH